MILPRCLSRLVAGLAVGACLALAGKASAAMILSVTITHGASTTIMDMGPGDLNPAPNAIAFVQVVGNYLVIGAVSSNNPGAATGQLLANYSATRIGLDNPAALSLNANQMNFNTPGNATAQLRLESTLALTSFTGSTGGDAITLESLGDLTSAGLQTIVSPGGNFGPAMSIASPAFFTRAGDYSLEARSTVNLQALGTNVVFNSASEVFLQQEGSVVPEPTSALVFLATAPVAAFVGWRRRRKA